MPPDSPPKSPAVQRTLSALRRAYSATMGATSRREAYVEDEEINDDDSDG